MSLINRPGAILSPVAKLQHEKNKKWKSFQDPQELEVQRWMQRVSTNINTMIGSVGERVAIDVGNSVVTFGELERLGFVQIPADGNVASTVATLPPNVYPPPDYTLPPTPVGLTLTAHINTILLEWGGYLASDAYYQYSEVWRGPTADIVDAVFLATTEGTMYLDNSIADDNVYYYWVRNVAPSGLNSQFNSVLGTGIQLADTAVSTIDELVTQINNQQENGAEVLTMSDSLFGVEHIDGNGVATYPFVISVVDNVTKIALNASAFIPDLTVDSVRIEDLAVEEAKIASLAVGEASIADANISTGLFADATIESAKIDTAAVTTAKLATDSVFVPAVSYVHLFESVNVNNGGQWLDIASVYVDVAEQGVHFIFTAVAPKFTPVGYGSIMRIAAENIPSGNAGHARIVRRVTGSETNEEVIYIGTNQYQYLGGVQLNGKLIMFAYLQGSFMLTAALPAANVLPGLYTFQMRNSLPTVGLSLSQYGFRLQHILFAALGSRR